MEDADPATDLADLLDGCAREPIHVPGAIQPHGSLLAFRDGVVVTASADRADALGRRDVDVFGEAATRIREAAPRQPLTVDLADGAGYEVTSHALGDLRVVEIEPAGEPDRADQLELLRALRMLQAVTTTDELLDATTSAVRALTGFDRVMVYRFDPEWNGEVVAEAKAPELDPFLGLRYPASDIPPQARALYLRNPIRLIPDADHEPVPLVAVPDAPGTTLDLRLGWDARAYEDFLAKMLRRLFAEPGA